MNKILMQWIGGGGGMNLPDLSPVLVAEPRSCAPSVQLHQWSLETNKRMQHIKWIRRQRENKNTVKPVLSRHPRDLPKCSLNTGCPLNKGL